MGWYGYPGELERVSSFEKEQIGANPGIMVVRYFLLIILTGVLYNSVRVNDSRALYMYLTSWG